MWDKERIMPIPLLALAAPAILKGIGGFLKGRGQKKAAKEQLRAEKEGIENKFRSDTDRFENEETGRQGRATFASQQLQGARALSPEVIKAALSRRKNTAYRGSAVDRSKGMDYNMLGEGSGALGDIASSMGKESMISQAGGGGGDSGILSKSSQMVSALPSVEGLDTGPIGGDVNNIDLANNPSKYWRR
jgi:hypothetical protein